jgi:hypothetical protein
LDQSIITVFPGSLAWTGQRDMSSCQVIMPGQPARSAWTGQPGQVSLDGTVGRQQGQISLVISASTGQPGQFSLDTGKDYWLKNSQIHLYLPSLAVCPSDPLLELVFVVICFPTSHTDCKLGKRHLSRLYSTPGKLAAIHAIEKSLTKIGRMLPKYTCSWSTRRAGPNGLIKTMILLLLLIN